MVALGADVFEVREQPRDEAIVGRGTGHIRMDDADPAIRADEGPECGRGDRGLQRRDHGGSFIGNGSLVSGAYDGGALRGEFDGESAASVGKVDFHGGMIGGGVLVCEEMRVAGRACSCERSP